MADLWVCFAWSWAVWRAFSLVVINVISKKPSKLFLVVESCRPIGSLLRFTSGTVLHSVSHWAAAEARSSLLVESLFVGGAVPGDVALLTAVKAVRQRVFRLFAFLVRVVLGAAFIAKTAFGCRAFAKEMLARSTFKTTLLMPFTVLEFSCFLLLPGKLFLYSSVVILLKSSAFDLWIHDQVVGIG